MRSSSTDVCSAGVEIAPGSRVVATQIATMTVSVGAKNPDWPDALFLAPQGNGQADARGGIVGHSSPAEAEPGLPARPPIRQLTAGAKLEAELLLAGVGFGAVGERCCGGRCEPRHHAREKRPATQLARGQLESDRVRRVTLRRPIE